MTTTTQLRRIPHVALLLLSWLSLQCSCYPLVATVPEDDDMCYRFNIPEDDDAHMVFVALPGDHVDDTTEEWFVTQVEELIKARTTTPKRVLPRSFVNKQPPKEVQRSMDDFLQHHNKKRDEGIKLSIEKPRRPAQRAQDLHWFRPVVINHVERVHNRHMDFDSGYAICFQNHNEDDEGIVVFDIVLVSEKEEKEELAQQKSITKEHLTPLEENLHESIDAAESILNEMVYLEKREGRMRQTADSINSKVRLFSWLSVIILLSVTYVQVKYLKRYFHKKKLL